MMFEDDDDDFGEDLEDVLRRFEQQTEQHIHGFFDEDEFNDIIAHYLDSEDAEMAKHAIDSALTIYPDSFNLLIHKVDYLILTENLEAALQLVEKIELTNPKEPYLFLAKGRVLHLLGKFEESFSSFQQALVHSKAYYKDIIESIISFYFDVSDWKSALFYLEPYSKNRPEKKELYEEIAYCYEILNNLDEAVDFYNKSLDIDPFDEIVWCNYAKVLECLGRNDEALEAYDFALAIDPKNEIAIDRKIANLLEHKNFEAAIEICKDQIEEAPEDFYTYIRIGNVFAEIGNDGFAQAYFNHALILAPESAEANYAIGQSYLRTDDNEKAIRYLMNAVSLDDSNYIYWIGLGKGYLEAKNFELAINAFTMAVCIDGDEIDGYLLAARSMLAVNKIMDALFLIREVENNFEEDAQVFIVKALLLYRMKCNGQMMEALKKAYELEPDSINSFFDMLRPDVDDEFVETLMAKIKH